jgi:hypothetical protein
MILGMEHATSIRLVLEAKLDRGSISGALWPDGADAVRFSGWLGLVAAIDAAARLRAPGRPAEPARDLLEGRLEPATDSRTARGATTPPTPPS